MCICVYSPDFGDNRLLSFEFPAVVAAVCLPGNAGFRMHAEELLLFSWEVGSRSKDRMVKQSCDSQAYYILHPITNIVFGSFTRCLMVAHQWC